MTTELSSQEKNHLRENSSATQEKNHLRETKYQQSREIEIEDISYESPVYQIEIYKKRFLITIGKEKDTFAKRHIYYYPVYVIYKNRVKAQIGAFEYESLDKDQKSRIRRFLDEDGDIDLNRLGDIILYHFVDAQFLSDLQVEYTEDEIAKIEKDAAIVKRYSMNFVIGDKDSLSTVKATDDDEEDEDNLLDDTQKLTAADIKTVSDSPSKRKADEAINDGIFTVDPSKKIADQLREETKEDSKEAKKDFRKSSKNKWIENFMSNKNYDIVETAANGDCFFDTIRIAFQQAGQITTVQKLRALLASEADDELYDQYKNLYMATLSEKSSIEKKMGGARKTNTELKKRLQKEANSEERGKIVDDGKRIIEEYKDLKEEINILENQLDEYKFMEGVDSLDQFRAVIQTTRYWADTWAISTLERVLNIKIILLDENAFQQDIASVIHCGQLNDEDLEKQGQFNPKFYIMTSYSGSHYRLITYKRKGIFSFQEIPYDIKVLVTIKCLERMGGAYYLIQDFRNFRSRLGLDPDQGFICDDDDNYPGLSYDKDTVFTFHGRSNHIPKPGKGMQEKLPNSRANDFLHLQKKKNVNWRRILDDDWISEGNYFSTDDGMRWASVTHYVEAAKYKKQNPHFYERFSMTDGKGDPDLNRNIEYVKAADTKTGFWVDKTDKTIMKRIRPEAMKIDPDYYANGRGEQEREKALYAKFSQSQNSDYKEILLSTKDAKLMNYHAKSEPTVDCLLMKVRTILENMAKRPQKVEAILSDILP